jgi:hypothetical protein
VLEKLDGSCIQVYWDCDKQEWFAGTTGTAEGEGEVNNKMGTTFNQLFWSVVSEKYDFKKENLNKLFCYVFELTTPYNIVVKPHGESAATLLMARNLVTLEEVPFEALTGIADSLGVPRVKSYDLNAKNVGALLRTFENMVWHDEGYVVVDANFNRVKIKNPAYVAVHHLKGKTAEHNIMTIVKTNEIEEFAATFIDRKKEVFELKSKYDSLIELLEKIKLELVEFLPKNITPKENKRYAEAVFNICDKYRVKGFSGLFFMLKDGKVVSISDYIINYDDKKLYNFLLGR